MHISVSNDAVCDCFQLLGYTTNYHLGITVCIVSIGKSKIGITRL